MLEIADELRKIADRIDDEDEGLYVRLGEGGNVYFSNSGCGDDLDGPNWLDKNINLGEITIWADKWTKIKIVEA